MNNYYTIGCPTCGRRKKRLTSTGYVQALCEVCKEPFWYRMRITVAGKLKNVNVRVTTPYSAALAPTEAPQ